VTINIYINFSVLYLFCSYISATTHQITYFCSVWASEENVGVYSHYIVLYEP